MSEEEKFLIWVGELSTQDNLKNIHPEHIKHICEQARNIYLDAFVAELEQVINQSLGIYPSEMKYKLLTELKYDIKQTAKRMKGEG